MTRMRQHEPRPRTLIITADDFGIGTETSRGIVALALERRITCTVLLVNSPFAEHAVQLWRNAGASCDLGWHPCLTIDRPIATDVPCLTDTQGSFCSLSQLLMRLALGWIRAAAVKREWTAQLQRFRELTGFWPRVVNAHHHVQVFPPLGAILREVLAHIEPKPYLRRIRECWGSLRHVPGARPKRLFLHAWGNHQAAKQARAGFPGNDTLVGISNPLSAPYPWFFQRCIESATGDVVELTCHPGHFDHSLIGRDERATAQVIAHRPLEWAALREVSFSDCIREQGFQLTRPTDLTSNKQLMPRCAG